MAETGDIFNIPINSNDRAIGQICAKDRTESVSLMVIGDKILSKDKSPTNEELIHVLTNPAIIVESFDNLISSGEWPTLAHMPPVLCPKHFPAYNASYGLPWNISLVVESWDRSKRRLARPWELTRFKTRLTVSPKLLEDLLKNHFLKSKKWDRKYDRILNENCYRF